MFPAEESVSADLPAGLDLPLVVRAERVCACARRAPLRELFARLTQSVPGNRTNHPFPSPRTLRQTLSVQEGCGWEGASLLREGRPDPDPFPLPFPPGQVPPEALGLPGLRGGQPRGVTGGTWGCWDYGDPSATSGPHRSCRDPRPVGRRRGVAQPGTPKEQQQPPPGPAAPSHSQKRTEDSQNPPKERGSAEFVSQVGARALSAPTPSAHTGQDPAVTQRVGIPGAGKGSAGGKPALPAQLSTPERCPCSAWLPSSTGGAPTAPELTPCHGGRARGLARR